VVGGILGLLQYIEKTYFKENITDLKVWKDRKQVLYYLKIFKRNHLLDKVKIVIIGGNGTCGTGVIDVLDDLDLKYTILGSKDEKKELKEYDIIFNCIRLNDNSKEIWFDKETEITKPLIISDISCDYTRENNPIKIYDKATTWEKPVFNYNEYVDIIAIDNLPSLLPKESSDVFSKKCVELLTTLDDEPWEKCEQIFFTEIYNKI
jgi:saccharopine dehydrogenase (NAD+, L-lysine-forming)